MEVCQIKDAKRVIYNLNKRVAVCVYGSFYMWNLTKKYNLKLLKSLYGNNVDIFTCSYEKTNIGEEFNHVYMSVIFPVIPMDRIANDRNGYEKERFIANLNKGVENRQLESGCEYKKCLFYSSNSLFFLSTDISIEVISYNYIQVIENNISKKYRFDRHPLSSDIIKGLFPDIFYNTNMGNIQLPETNESDVLFLISSVIDATISEDSIFDKEERRSQLIEQCKSIRQNVSNSKIIIIECSFLTMRDLFLLNDVADCIVNFKGDPYSEHLTHTIRDKTRSEAYTLSVVVNALKSRRFKNLFKMTSRYRVLKTFDLNNFSNEFAMFRPTDGSISYSRKTSCDSIFYSVPFSLLELYYRVLTEIQQNRQMYIDMEHALHQLFDGHYIGINRDDILGFSAAGLYNQL